MTLLIMAAGIGSRFGTGIKQLEPVGLHDEIIMDYSIHDAIAAGFRKIIFVIRRDIEEDFRERIGNRVEQICRELQVETAYAFQDLKEIPEGFSVPEGRTERREPSAKCMRKRSACCGARRKSSTCTTPGSRSAPPSRRPRIMCATCAQPASPG